MRSNLSVLSPTPSLVSGLVLIIFAQWVYFTQSYVGYDLTSAGGKAATTVSSTYGLGAPVKVATVDGETAHHIRGFRLAANLVLSYGLAALFACVRCKFAPPLTRPGQHYAAAIIVMVVATFLFSIGWSKSYWGYFIARPSVLPEIHDFVAVNAIVPLKMNVEGETPAIIIVAEEYDLAESLQYAIEDSYYALDQRLLPPLRDKGLLPESPTSTLANLPELYPLFLQTGLLAPAEEGYRPYDYLRGVAIDGRDASGRRLLTLGLSAGQVSDDHFPYYELLFTAPGETTDFTFIRGQRFFFDRAGLEGFEWYAMFVLLLVPAIGVGCLLIMLGRIVSKFRKRRLIKITDECDLTSIRQEA